MTLAGTLVVRRDGHHDSRVAGYHTVHLKSRAIDQQFIKSLFAWEESSSISAGQMKNASIQR